MTGFDPRWLTSPVGRSAVRGFTAEMRRQGTPTTKMTTTVIAYTFIGVVASFVLVPIVTGMLDADGTRIIAVIAIPVIIATVLTLIARAALRRDRTAQYRLHNFAAANGMAYLPHIVDPALPGLIFNQGRSRRAVRRVRGTQPRFVEFANYRYTTGSGKNSTTHVWGYVAIHLDTPLPHIVLDAKGNNGLFGSNLPTSFDRGQRLSLEGSFDEFFTLYCPRGYETDALYLFTPDIMARFMDNAAELDVEIVDNWLFLYAKRDFVTLDPDMWGWLFSVVSALMDKLQRWERWRDARLTAQAARPRVLPATGEALPFRGDQQVIPPQGRRGPKGVAAHGRRLSTNVRWWAIAVGAAVALGVAWIFVWSVLTG
ncbi:MULTISPECIES: hypothetical protein [unclassified Microbacterium]|uniref:hypothetical protein n=1 Tax=unclassified Microbacterium TaxID=2609290 RepID=UPI00097F34B7|nr:hypothetical protein [Microbacterium sp. JB110]RCS60701.1 hypothetical protein CIK77_08450 [Microbacterium sp. JB110]SJM44793.1 hypothetical protein CZ774_01430 [Frigoribacterium sp. JB110]